MSSNRRKTDDASGSWLTRRHRLRLECRECEVICERVVSPWHCLQSACPYVYVFGEGEASYFGCLHKVFSPELDFAAFAGTYRRQGGRRSDPYGYLRISRSPRPECSVRIEQAYAALATPGCCCNPMFFLHPSTSSEEIIKLTTNISRSSDFGPRS